MAHPIQPYLINVSFRLSGEETVWLEGLRLQPSDHGEKALPVSRYYVRKDIRIVTNVIWRFCRHDSKTDGDDIVVLTQELPETHLSKRRPMIDESTLGGLSSRVPCTQTAWCYYCMKIVHLGTSTGATPPPTCSRKRCWMLEFVLLLFAWKQVP